MMCIISIRNCDDKDLRKELRNAAKYYSSYLFPKAKDLKITIKLNPYLSEKDDMDASCQREDEKIYTIEIESSISLEDKLKYLAHEFAHVKQYFTRQMIPHKSNENISIWEGNEYDDTKIPYEDTPWERDAKTYENLMYKSYLDYKNG